MAINPTNKLVWLVKTIHQAGKILFKEIQQKWRGNEEDMRNGSIENWLLNSYSVTNSLVSNKHNK